MRPVTMQTRQLEPFAHFLEEHPGFSPRLMGEEAHVCGFQVGGCFLWIDEIERLIASRPRYDARQEALLLSAPGVEPKRRP